MGDDVCPFIWVHEHGELDDIVILSGLTLWLISQENLAKAPHSRLEHCLLENSCPWQPALVCPAFCGAFSFLSLKCSEIEWGRPWKQIMFKTRCPWEPAILIIFSLYHLLLMVPQACKQAPLFSVLSLFGFEEMQFTVFNLSLFLLAWLLQILTPKQNVDLRKMTSIFISRDGASVLDFSVNSACLASMNLSTLPGVLCSTAQTLCEVTSLFGGCWRHFPSWYSYSSDLGSNPVPPFLHEDDTWHSRFIGHSRPLYSSYLCGHGSVEALSAFLFVPVRASHHMDTWSTRLQNDLVEKDLNSESHGFWNNSFSPSRHNFFIYKNGIPKNDTVFSECSWGLEDLRDLREHDTED